MRKLNLKDLDFDGLTQALAPLEATRRATLKLFAAVYAHGAQSLEELKNVPQVTAKVRDWVQEHGELPRLSVVERRRAVDRRPLDHLLHRRLGAGHSPLRARAAALPVGVQHHLRDSGKAPRGDAGREHPPAARADQRDSRVRPVAARAGDARLRG